MIYFKVVDDTEENPTLYTSLNLRAEHIEVAERMVRKLINYPVTLIQITEEEYNEGV